MGQTEEKGFHEWGRIQSDVTMKGPRSLLKHLTYSVQEGEEN